jgi:carbonic anhydrase
LGGSRNEDLRDLQSLAIALAFGVPTMSTAISAQEPHPPHWAYEGKEGPADWGKLDRTYATCSLGHTQSPIDIQGAKPADLPALKFDYKAVPLNIIDNGHTIQINYPAGSTLLVGDKTYTRIGSHLRRALSTAVLSAASGTWSP